MRRKLSGLNYTPKSGNTCRRIGRGAMYGGRSVNGSGRGRHTRENAGISSENVVRNYVVESLRFPGEGSSTQG